MKKQNKSQSKRITCHKRYKIVRKVKEHHRKLRKAAKGVENKVRRKDANIPNSLPFKEDIFTHVDFVKKQDSETRLYNLKNGAKGKLTTTASDPAPHRSSAGAYRRESDKVISEADVILEVLDARDPNGTRCIEAEKRVSALGKRLVLIINKIDLVPRPNLQLWLNYLRQSFTVLPFKANTQEQQHKLGRSSIPWTKVNFETDGRKTCSKGMGASDLMSLLANYRKLPGGDVGSTKDRLGLTIGVIGLPNTGKSSLINTLKRQRVCLSGNVPGMTKLAQRVKLDKDLYLIDSPGVASSACSDPNELMLKNCLKPESLPDPTPVVELIIQRCGAQQIIDKYGLEIDVSDDTMVFLAELAGRLGKIKKGGRPNTTLAARSLINDWISGKLTYFTQPPEICDDPVDNNNLSEDCLEMDATDADAIMEEDEDSA